MTSAASRTFATARVKLFGTQGRPLPSTRTRSTSFARCLIRRSSSRSLNSGSVGIDAKRRLPLLAFFAFFKRPKSETCAHSRDTKSSLRSPVMVASFKASATGLISRSSAFAQKRAMSLSVHMISARCPLRYRLGMPSATFNKTLPFSIPNRSKARSTVTPMSAARGVADLLSRQSTTLARMRASLKTARGTSPHFSSMTLRALPQVRFVLSASASQSGLEGRFG